MKRIVPVESKSLDVPGYPSFGRTPLYVSFDTETGNHEFLDNFVATSQSGAEIKVAQLEKLSHQYGIIFITTIFGGVSTDADRNTIHSKIF